MPDDRAPRNSAWIVQAQVGTTIVWATGELVGKCGLRGFDMAAATCDPAERLAFDNLGAAQFAADRLQEASGLSWSVLDASASATEMHPERAHGRVVIVDDHVDSRSLHAERLRDHGFAVDEFASAEEALESIPGAVVPRVVILDIALAGEIDGFEAARRIRARFDRHTLRLVAMTGRAREDVRDSSVHFDAILIKPVGPVELLAAVTRLSLSPSGGPPDS